MPGLKAFIRGSSDPKDAMPGCANYDRDADLCHTGVRCFVLKGGRCVYFERAVLPTAGQLKAKDGRKIVDEYQRAYGMKKLLKVNLAQTRYCPCGNPIRGGRRFCDKCKKKRRLKTYREAQQKYRSGQMSTVVQKSPL